MDFTSYVSLDLETTGLEPATCDVIEVAMIKVEKGKIVDRFESFVFTPLEISQHVSYLTGIRAKDIENAPDFVELIPQIESFIGDSPLMGHNIWFDWNFLTKKGCNLERNPLWDTYIFSNLLYPELPSHSLETNSKYFNIHHVDSHRAMADVMACYELWKILIESFPQLSPEQREKIQALKPKCTWPMIDFFLQEKPAHKHQLNIPEAALYKPKSMEPLPYDHQEGHLFIHCQGEDPVDLAKGLQTQGKTLYIAGYEHTRNKLKQVFPEALHLQGPHSYFSAEKLKKLSEKEQLEDAEVTLLLKTILHPEHLSREELVLSHPERKIWTNLQTEDDESLSEESSYRKMYQKSLEAEKVITSHYHILNDLDYVQNFDQIVILEPQLLEDNATRSFGKGLTLEDWLKESKDEDWVRQGEHLFARVNQLGQSLVPSSQYPEHLVLNDLIIQSNEFIRLKSTVLEIIEGTSDEKCLNYLKYFQAFFHTHDPSWIRWITVDPLRGVRLHVAPLSVKALLNKHLFSKCSVLVLSDTADHYDCFPDMEIKNLSTQNKIQIKLPDLERITGTKKEGDHQAIMGYLTEKLPEQKGKTAVIFSSKSALKRYFFDIVQKMPEDMLMLGEDISGGIGKFRDRYANSDHENKVVFMTYRNLRLFAPELLDFDSIFLQSLPFDPPGLPLHQVRAAQFQNPFIEYSLPHAAQNLLEIVSNFTKREGDKKLVILDRRAQEKSYGEELLDLFE